MSWTRKEPWQNKANFKQPDPDPEVQSRKTKPNLGRMGHLEDGASRGPIVRNEANLPAGTGPQGRGTWVKCAKRTQFARRCRVGRGFGGVGRGELCETNPILRLRIADWIQSCGGTPAVQPAASAVRRPIVRNEPNFARAPRNGRGRAGPPRAKCAKRTQSGPAWAGPGTRWRKLQNEPNFGELAGGWNTQHSTILSFHHSGPMPIVRNEANCPLEGVGRGRPTYEEPIVRNEANLAGLTRAMTGRLTVSSHLRWSRLYWAVTGNRRTAMERGRL
jgi:hypothetical protein